ncbi:Pathogenesis-related transcriptional factor and ERF protein [Salmonella enterica subsp. diarizonae]|nr:Pathogenesis-related transcriptional factor and ERF protein [Salmonella enterica subsp. diarizonae]
MCKITQSYLHQILNYEPETGVFTWKSPGNRAFIGRVAGCLDREGYVYFYVNKKRYFAHRLAWLYVYGFWPANLIDHVNGVRSDNRIINLREATRTECNRNSRRSKKNTSGVKGVHWSKNEKKWRARCGFNGKQHSLGYFLNITDAERAVIVFRKKHHGEFANQGGFYHG